MKTISSKKRDPQPGRCNCSRAEIIGRLPKLMVSKKVIPEGLLFGNPACKTSSNHGFSVEALVHGEANLRRHQIGHAEKAAFVS